MATFQEIVKGDIPVLIDFHADWCAPCKMMQPILKSIKNEFGDSIKILKINVDNNRSVSEKFNVKGVPTFILFFQGEIIWRKSGTIAQENFIDILKSQF